MCGGNVATQPAAVSRISLAVRRLSSRTELARFLLLNSLVVPQTRLRGERLSSAEDSIFFATTLQARQVIDGSDGRLLKPRVPLIPLGFDSSAALLRKLLKT